MIKFLRDLFRRRSPIDLITRELSVAKLSRHHAIANREHAASVVVYHDDKIERLTKLLAETGGERVARNAQ